MATRTLNIPITSDTKSFERGMNRVQKQTGAVEKRINKFSNATKAAFLTAGAAAAGGLVVGLKKSVDAAIEAQKSQAKLDAQLKAVGTSYRAHAKEIENVIQKTSRLSGLDDEDLQDAFTAVVRATGDVNVAMKDMGVVADLARAKNMDVAKAGELVAKVHAGSVGPLKRMGIEFVKTTTNVDKLRATNKKFTPEQLAAAKAADVTANSQRALGLLQDKVKGQAKAYGETAAGAQDRFKVAVEGLQEKLGGLLLPQLTKVADKAAKFVREMEAGRGAGGRFARQVQAIATDLKNMLAPLVDVGKWLARHPSLLKAAGAAFVAYKVAAIAQLAAVKIAALGLFGPSMRTKLASEAAKGGASTGRSFAAKAGALAAAGVAGWEIGKWARQNDTVRAAGDWLGSTLAKAMGNKVKEALNNDLAPAIEQALGIVNDALPGKTPKKKKHSKNDTPPVKKPAHTLSAQGVKHVALPGSTIATAAGRVTARTSGAGVSGDIGGLNGDFLGRLQAMAAGTGRSISVRSGYRSSSEQAVLYQKYLNGTGNLAAPPGSSNHERGIAADISPGREAFGSVAGRYGLAFTVPSESWHIEMSGGGGGGATRGTTTGSTGPSATQRRAATVKKQAAAKKSFQRDQKSQVQRQAAARKKSAAYVKSGPSTKGKEDWYGLVGATLENIDLRYAAGRITESQMYAEKEQFLRGVIPMLSGNRRLEMEAELKNLYGGPLTSLADTTEADTKAQDLIDAQKEAAEAAREQTEALNAIKDEMERNRRFAESSLSTQNAVAWKALSDFLSGQIAGFGGYAGRAATAGAGSTYRL